MGTSWRCIRWYILVMLFTTLAIKPIKEKVSRSMGNTFDSAMPEKHYIDKISDLEYRLSLLESILKEITDANISFNALCRRIQEAIEYFKQHEETK